MPDAKSKTKKKAPGKPENKEKAKEKPKAEAQESKKHAEKKAKSKTTEHTKKPAPESEPEKTEAPETSPDKKTAKEKAVKKATEKKIKPIAKIQFHTPKKTEKQNLRKKKPLFLRQEGKKFKRLAEKWRVPRGIDSKQQDGMRSKGRVPSVGYKNPKEVSSLHMGYVPVVVYNTLGLAKVKSQTEAAVIASSVGRLKRNQIIEQANKMKVVVLNPRRGEL